jgi:hypothetical protein
MKYACAAVVLLVSAGCSTIREEMPTSPSNNSAPSGPPPAPIPVVVVPVPIPVPSSVPAPAPAPNPNPNPAPNPGGGDGFSNNPVTQVTAGVHSYLRNGRLVPTGGTEFKVGDVVYLNCTPRGEDRKPIERHGPLQGWFISGDAKYRVTDTDTFNPDLHTQGPGKVRIACKVDNITSPTTTLTINP